MGRPQQASTLFHLIYIDAVGSMALREQRRVGMGRGVSSSAAPHGQTGSAGESMPLGEAQARSKAVIIMARAAGRFALGALKPVAFSGSLDIGPLINAGPRRAIPARKMMRS